MAVLAVIGILIFIFSQVAQSGIDERLTKEGYERAQRFDDLVYYDQQRHCYRSMKTNQKASRYVTRDANGEWYEYIVNVPPFATMIAGDFIEARYLDKRKWNEPVQFGDREKERFFGGK